MLPMKDFSRNINLGLYVGVIGQDSFDWKTCFEALHPTAINGISVFLNDPWNNPDGFYPWSLNPAGTKYNLTKFNPDFYAHVNECLIQAAVCGGFRVEFCFYTSYFDKRWRNSTGYGLKLHPFVENNFGISLDGKNGEKLYENWKKTGFNPSDFWWLQWKAQPDDTIISANGANKLGVAMVDSVRKIMNMMQAAKAMYKQRANYWIRAFNEPDVSVDASGHPVGGLDADPRVENWLDKEMKDRGFKAGPKYKLVRGGTVYQDGKPSYSAMAKNAKWCGLHGNMYEVHGAEYAVINWMRAAGAPDASTIYSLDGVKDDQVSAEAKQILAAPQLQKINLDIKLSDTWVQPKWNVRNMNYNFANAIPELLDVLKALP